MIWKQTVKGFKMQDEIENKSHIGQRCGQSQGNNAQKQWPLEKMQVQHT